jgi:16S rRNA processing protein RimM
MTSEKQTSEPWTILARLVRPQGRHGEILADILTDFPDRFADRRRLFLVSSETSQVSLREVTLENHWMHKSRVVLKFAGIDSIHDAEALRRLLVAIPTSERAKLTDDSFYVGDLIGCQVIDLNAGAATIGTVADVDYEASLLAVTTPRGEEELIPFAKEYIGTINLAGKRIEMRLPAGLLEINSPMTDEERCAHGVIRNSR